jgi:DNA invertase Pin-like site-specific DNA recombinase
MAKKRPAYAYLRVSTKGQLMEGHGLGRQEELIRQFSTRAGFDIVTVYSDAYTGTEADRPNFTRMLAEMMTNGVKTVIVESLDRLARDLYVQTLLLAKLAAEELTLVAANTGEDVTAAMTEDPMRRAMVQIQGVFAELNRAQTVHRLRKGREAAREETGRCEGRKPYGARDGESAAITRIAELRKAKPKPFSLQRIADVLNADQATYPTRTGKPWSKQLVKNILDRAKERRGGSVR